MVALVYGHWQHCLSQPHHTIDLVVRIWHIKKKKKKKKKPGPQALSLHLYLITLHALKVWCFED